MKNPALETPPPRDRNHDRAQRSIVTSATPEPSAVRYRPTYSVPIFLSCARQRRQTPLQTVRRKAATISDRCVFESRSLALQRSRRALAKPSKAEFSASLACSSLLSRRTKDPFNRTPPPTCVTRALWILLTEFKSTRHWLFVFSRRSRVVWVRAVVCAERSDRARALHLSLKFKREREREAVWGVRLAARHA